MSTKTSGICKWFAGQVLGHAQLESSGTLESVTRLGNVKVETKGPTGDAQLDNLETMERFP
jgi:hypothetical protein